MTKSELVELVEHTFATFNSTLPIDEGRLKTVLSAWYDLLHDLSYEESHRAVLDLAVSSTFLPRPGDIRRAAINGRTKIPPFDEPIVAWGKWLTLQKEVNSGMPPSIPVSEALQKTVSELGESAYGMHTNSDREQFMKAYERVVSQMDKDRYKVPTLIEE